MLNDVPGFCANHHRRERSHAVVHTAQVGREMRSIRRDRVGEEGRRSRDSGVVDEDVAALALLLHKGGGLVHGTDCRYMQSRASAEPACG